MEPPAITVLVVDDYEPWRRFVRSALDANSKWQVIGEAADGLAAVHQAYKLKPHLVILNIGLPTISGIEAARRIRKFSPSCGILFLSENRSADIVEEALRSGGNGYLVKSDAAAEFALAVEAVVRGSRFVSSSLSKAFDCPDPGTGFHRSTNRVIEFPSPNLENQRRHEVLLYSEDQQLLDRATIFVGSALRAGNAAIVAATELHRTELLPRLQLYAIDISAAVEQDRYLALDAADALSTFMRNGKPDPELFLWAFGDLITASVKATTLKQPRVAIFGECAHLLCEQGNVEAAIQLEKLGNQLARTHAVDILCGYSWHRSTGHDPKLFERICAEHSAVHLQ